MSMVFKIIAILAFISIFQPGFALDLSSSGWTAFYDKSRSATIEQIASLPDSAWVLIVPGRYWEDQQIYGWPKDVEGQEIIWYRCRFDGTGEFADKEAVFFAGAIDDYDIVYLNSVKIGATGSDVPNAYRTARAYPVPKALFREKNNELLIKVIDCGGKGGIRGLPVAFYRKEVYDEYCGWKKTPNPFGLRMYDQELSIVCADNAAARRVELDICPLFNSAQWAFSGRWDDDNIRHPEMKELLRKYGFKATFYLNTYPRDGAFVISKYFMTTAPLLVQDGFSIGGHTLHHPNLSQVDKNQLFRQIAADRVYLEYAVGKPVNSFAFPGSDFGQSKTAGVRIDIAEALIRSGFLHSVTGDFTREEIGNRSILVENVNIIDPGDEYPDSARFDSFIKWYTGTDTLKTACPNMTVGIHVQHKPGSLEKLGQCLERYANNPDWWYCNQNEYAAYRYQYKAGKLEKVKVVDNVAFFRLSRPYGADMGDDVPLSLKVKNAQVSAVAPGTAKSEIIQYGDTAVINVYQDPAMGIPAVIDMYENRGNLPEAQAVIPGRLPGVQFFVHVDEKAGIINFSGRNNSAHACESITLTVRVPLRYMQSGQRVDFGRLDTSEKRSAVIPLGAENSSADYQAGNPYYIVQADFVYDGRPVRFYATAFVLNVPESMNR